METTGGAGGGARESSGRSGGTGSPLRSPGLRPDRSPAAPASVASQPCARPGGDRHKPPPSSTAAGRTPTRPHAKTRAWPCARVAPSTPPLSATRAGHSTQMMRCGKARLLQNVRVTTRGTGGRCGAKDEESWQRNGSREGGCGGSDRNSDLGVGGNEAFPAARASSQGKTPPRRRVGRGDPSEA